MSHSFFVIVLICLYIFRISGKTAMGCNDRRSWLEVILSPRAVQFSQMASPQGCPAPSRTCCFVKRSEVLHEVNIHPELNSWICFHRNTETVLGLAKKQPFFKKETTKYHTKQFPRIAGQDFAVWMSLKALRRVCPFCFGCLDAVSSKTLRCIRQSIRKTGGRLRNTMLRSQLALEGL